MSLNQELTLKVIAAKWGLKTARGRGYLGYRLRECLDTLAVIFGYARNMDRKEEQQARKISHSETWTGQLEDERRPARPRGSGARRFAPAEWNPAYAGMS